LRISLGIENTKEDIDVLISVLREIGNNHGTGRNEEFIHDDKGKNHLSEKKIKNRINEFVRSRVQMVYSD